MSPTKGALVLLALLSAVPASAQVGWTVDNPLLTTGPIDQPALAVNGAGSIAVVSVRCITPTDCTVGLARASSDSSWTLTTVGSFGTYAAPDAAMDAAGNILIVWEAPAGIQAARVAVAGPGMPPPPVLAVTLSAPGAVEPQVAMDSSGNAMVAWVTDAGAVEVARYDVGTGVWSPPEPLPVNDGGALPQVALDEGGNAFVAWARTVSFGAVVVGGLRFDAGTGTWGLAAMLSDGLEAVGSVVLDVDRDGNAVVVWDQLAGGLARVVASRYLATAGTWGPAVTLSSPGVDAAAPVLDLDEAGNITALWTRYDFAVEGSRFVVSSGGWLAPVRLTGPDVLAILPSVAVDPRGNATFTWLEARDVGGAVRSARFTSDNRFVALLDLTTSDVEYRPLLGVDQAGNVIALLPVASFSPTDPSLIARRWNARPAAPTLVGVTPGDGSLEIAFAPPPTTEPAFAPVNYECSLDGGVTWTPRAPASVTSPLLVTGLTNGTEYGVRLRAVNVAGPGAASGQINSTPAPGPDPPTGLLVTDVAGRVVTLSWVPAAAGTPATGYVIEGGLSPGEVLASIPTGSASPGFTFTAPPGAFFVRVRAVAGALRSAPSNEVPLFVTVPVAPSAPAYLLEAAHGDTLLLSWTPTFGGGAPTGYVLRVSGTISTPLTLPVSERFTFTGVPPGTYTFTVEARNAAGTSPPSNPVEVTFPASCIDGPLPGTPTRFRATVAGSTLTATWEPPTDGRGVSHYRLSIDAVVGGSPWIFVVPTTSRTLSGVVPAGTYTMSVAGANACFTGVSSPPVTVVVP